MSVADWLLSNGAKTPALVRAVQNVKIEQLGVALKPQYEHSAKHAAKVLLPRLNLAYDCKLVKVVKMHAL